MARKFKTSDSITGFGPKEFFSFAVQTLKIDMNQLNLRRKDYYHAKIFILHYITQVS